MRSLGCTMLKHLLMLTILIMTCSIEVLAQKREVDVSTRLQLALIDYEPVHAVLVERCTQSFPESVPALQKAIPDWQNKNREPLHEIRLIFRDKLASGQASMSKVDAQMASISKMMNNGLKEQFAKVPLTELEKACRGGFATTLQSPELDFEALLNKIRPAQPK